MRQQDHCRWIAAKGLGRKGIDLEKGEGTSHGCQTGRKIENICTVRLEIYCVSAARRMPFFTRRVPGALQKPNTFPLLIPATDGDLGSWAWAMRSNSEDHPGEGTMPAYIQFSCRPYSSDALSSAAGPTGRLTHAVPFTLPEAIRHSRRRAKEPDDGGSDAPTDVRVACMSRRGFAPGCVVHQGIQGMIV